METDVLDVLVVSSPAHSRKLSGHWLGGSASSSSFENVNCRLVHVPNSLWIHGPVVPYLQPSHCVHVSYSAGHSSVPASKPVQKPTPRSLQGPRVPNRQLPHSGPRRSASASLLATVVSGTVVVVMVVVVLTVPWMHSAKGLGQTLVPARYDTQAPRCSQGPMPYLHFWHSGVVEVEVAEVAVVEVVGAHSSKSFGQRPVVPSKPAHIPAWLVCSHSPAVPNLHLAHCDPPTTAVEVVVVEVGDVETRATSVASHELKKLSLAQTALPPFWIKAAQIPKMSCLHGPAVLYLQPAQYCGRAEVEEEVDDVDTVVAVVVVVVFVRVVVVLLVVVAVVVVVVDTHWSNKFGQTPESASKGTQTPVASFLHGPRVPPKQSLDGH